MTLTAVADPPTETRKAIVSFISSDSQNRFERGGILWFILTGIPQTASIPRLRRETGPGSAWIPFLLFRDFLIRRRATTAKSHRNARKEYIDVPLVLRKRGDQCEQKFSALD